MGAPIKIRKKYISHKQRWDKNTIDEEAVLVNDYSLKNKREIRKVEFKIGKFKSIAKELNSNSQTKNSEEAKNFIESLKGKGFLPIEANSLDEILDIDLRSVLDRRLSNILYKNKLARTPSQARQFIVHRHVRVNGKVVDSPSYSVTLKEEEGLEFKPSSSLVDDNHPERVLAAGGIIEELEVQEEIAQNVEAKSDFEEKEAVLEDEDASRKVTE